MLPGPTYWLTPRYRRRSIFLAPCLTNGKTRQGMTTSYMHVALRFVDPHTQTPPPKGTRKIQFLSIYRFPVVTLGNNMLLNFTTTFSPGKIILFYNMVLSDNWVTNTEWLTKSSIKSKMVYDIVTKLFQVSEPTIIASLIALILWLVVIFIGKNISLKTLLTCSVILMKLFKMASHDSQIPKDEHILVHNKVITLFQHIKRILLV